MFEGFCKSYISEGFCRKMNHEKEATEVEGGHSR